MAAAPLGVVYTKNLTPSRPASALYRSTGARLLRWSVRPNGRAAQLLMPFGDTATPISPRCLVSAIAAAGAQRRAQAEMTLIGKSSKVSVRCSSREQRCTAGGTPTEQQPATRQIHRARSQPGGCHRHDPNRSRSRPEFAGGTRWNRRTVQEWPSVWFRTPNLTPAPGSGLSKFPDRETFIARFQRGGIHYAGSPMPWGAYSRISTADLGALYEYLHSLEPQHGPSGEPTFAKGGAPSDVERRAAR